MKQAFALFLVVATAGQALAEVPPQECHDDGFGGYDVIWHHGGFVLYPGPYTDHDYKLVLEDCPGDRVLQITLAYSGTDLVKKWDRDEALISAVEEALRSEQRYTLRQIAGLARRQGARTKLGDAAYESCACTTYGTVNP